MTSRVATLRGIPISYEEIGEGSPVLVLHGLSLDHHVEMAAFEPIFAERTDTPGWRRIYPDLPGHGATPAPGWLAGSHQVLEVAEELVDTVAPGERLTLIGASWGAYLAHALASRRADAIAGLLLTVPVARAERTRRDLPPRTVLVSEPDALADVATGKEGWLEYSVVQTREMLERFRAGSGMAADEGFLERLQPRYALPSEDEMNAVIESPALIVAGRQDSIVGYRDAWPLLEHLPRASFAVLDRAGHALEDEQWSLLRALAHEWLDRVVEHRSRIAGSPKPGATAD